MEKFIGTILNERMNNLGISLHELSDKSLVDEDEIEKILNNKIGLNHIGLYDLDLISQVLYCRPDYFLNSNVRNADIINVSKISNAYINTIKGKIQQFGNDFSFLRKIKKGE